MPAKNSIKTYLENGIYHIYNRGVEKRNIYLDEQDYSVFISYLKNYLLPKDLAKLQTTISSPEHGYKEKQKAFKEISLKNFAEEIELLAYVLMPNHFHLLLKQTKPDGIDRFMSSLSTRYTIYFNRKYRRVGSLCQGVYKAVSVETDEQLLHLSRYIHLNPFMSSGQSLSRSSETSQPSSLPEYFNQRNAAWVKKNYILDYFQKNNPTEDYQKFMGITDTDPNFIAAVALDLDQ